MRATHVVPTLILLAGLVACGDAPDQPADAESPADTTMAEAVPTWVADVAAAANAIEARPSAADSILQAHEMTRMAFDSLLYEIAADRTLTAAYQEARQ